MTEEITKIVIAVLAKGLTVENVGKCADFLMASGKKIGDKFSAYLEKQKASDGNEENNEIPPEVQQEVQASLREVLKSVEKPVYLDGIAFFCNMTMDKEEQDLLEKILINIDYETESIEWGDDRNVAYQEIVDEFMEKNYGCAPDKNEKDYWIEEDCFCLNLGFCRPEDYYRILDDMEIRRLADALNQLLGDKYITSYMVY